MLVLGIDPGFKRFGYALVSDDYRIWLLDTLVVDVKKDFASSIMLVGDVIEKLFGSYDIDVVAIEEVIFGRNYKTANRVIEIKGVVSFLALRYGAMLYSFSPTEVKKAIVGYGLSNKADIKKALKIRFSYDDMLEAKLPDAIDSLAIALTYLLNQKELSWEKLY